ncbi:MAG: HAMP domain-containing histidine kinase, partial [Tannerella sp.]|nr:HAMP domain-containing histidine kinase [Tannerella sp.]
YFETQIYRQGKVFSIRTNKFDDNSFELIINDITRQEKLHTLKQEMTGNVAHELRTPITGIRAYLETLLNSSLDEEKRQYFISQAYSQTVVLSDLISDMSLLSKMDTAPLSFNLEKINIHELINQIATDFSASLKEKNIDLQNLIPAPTFINGNRNLLASIFRNLTDNSVRHAGENIHIRINIYQEDSEFHYFSFYDTGVGIKNDSHLNRLFERFYRIDEGRTRDAGGTGLGLSIVKNAVLFHKGSIIAKNRLDGGLEFLFNLHK